MLLVVCSSVLSSCSYVATIMCYDRRGDKRLLEVSYVLRALVVDTPEDDTDRSRLGADTCLI